MNTNYDDEATRYQGAENEDTQFVDVTNKEQKADTATSNNEVKTKSAKGTWKRAAAGAASGLLIGGVSTFLMGMKQSDANHDGGDKPEVGNHKEELSNPEWVDDQVQVATSVNDDMSFGEAFAAARAEVGPGGCFEWHGNVYGTYTADEWNSMTAEQRAEYSDHFSWNHIDHSASNVAQHSTHSNNTSTQTETASNDDDIEVVSVNHTDNHNDLAGTQHTTDQAEVVDVAQADPEVEILGVVHDSDTGANIGGMTVDGQEVILIDVDGDMGFDYMAADVNGNGQVDQEELVDIQGQGLTVNDLGGFSNPTGEMLASNDAPDYTSDAVYEG